MKIVVFTGAGISRESGLQTFRDSDGLWEGYDVRKVATPQAYAEDPELVLNFYNMRRKGVREAEPNDAHLAIAEMEKTHEVTIITQNIDDLHERAGSQNIIHIHGELMTVRGDGEEGIIYPWREDCSLGDLCPSSGEQLRPNIVWFGESVMRWTEAALKSMDCDVFIICGTSAQVYPAASLIQATTAEKIYLVDPNPPVIDREVITIEEPASTGMRKVLEDLI